MQTNSASRFYVGIDPSVSSTGVVVLDPSSDIPYLCLVLKHSLIHTGKVVTGGSFTDSWPDVPMLLPESRRPIFYLPSPVPQYNYSGVSNTLDVIQIEVMHRFYYDVFTGVLEFLHRQADVIQVSIEAPMTVMHQGRGNLVERSFICAIVACTSRDFTGVCTVNPSTHKKFTCGTGAAKKELVLKSVYKRWGFDTDLNDLADAYSIAQHLRNQLLSK